MAASTAIITDLTTAAGLAPTAASTAKSQAAAGPIEDLPGNMSIALLKAKELKVLITAIVTGTDSSDPNYTTLNNVLLTLV